MSDYWSGRVTFAGLGSGTDFGPVIDATMEVESHRYNRMEAWGEQWSTKLEQVQDVNNELTSYQTHLETMDTVNEFLVKSASSSDASVLSVAADADASEGSYSIEVGQKAQNDVWSSTSGWNSKDDVVTDTGGTFAMEYAGELLEIDIPAGTTLQGVVDLINADPHVNGDIRANTIDDGDQLHIQLRGMDQGADNSVTIVDQGAGGVAGLSPADFQHTQQAQNSQIRVDGYPGAGQWIERDSNTIDDVIDGLSFTILGVSEGDAINVNVVTDTNSIIANIESFVERTNTVRDTIRIVDEDYVDESTGETIDATGYQVRGNYGMDIVEQTLQDILASKGQGFHHYDAETNTGDPYASLATIGITTDADENSESFGHLVIDYEVLEDALADDPDAVARLFAAENEGDSSDPSLTFDSAIPSITAPGEHEVAYTVENGEIVNATINGQPATVDGWEITGTEGDGAGLAVIANIREDGEYGGTISLRQGKINETLDALSTFTSTEDGTLHVIEDSYQTIIDNNALAMERELSRLQQKEQNLIEHYARLEATLGYYENISASLDQQLASLG